MRLDLAVAQRLRDRRIVHFAVAVPPVADQVDHHGRLELVAVIERHLAHAHHRVWILRVHVENRDGQALGQIGGVTRRPAVLRSGRKADQVVHDNVNRAADRKALNARHVQHFGTNALARERRISVHHYRYHAPPAVFAAPLLLRAGPADHHRIDRFQMAGIRYQMNFHVASVRRVESSRSAHVIFHVAAAQGAAWVHVLESREHIRCRAPHGVHHHVEPSAMAHRQHRFFRALIGRRAQDRIQERNQRAFAFQRIPLRAQVARLQNLLEDIRANQQIENSRPVRLRRIRFHALLDPCAFLAVRNVHEFHADAAAVNAPCGVRLGSVAVQLRHRRRFQITQRIDAGLQVSPAAKRFPDAVLQRSGRCGFRDCLFPTHTLPIPQLLICSRPLLYQFLSS